MLLLKNSILKQLDHLHRLLQLCNTVSKILKFKLM